ncbi:hypothetical protein QAD02_011949 [Eretmocerus hayati]|uniref:Uncharacterized protein n=1 Tax=Eretmocerus hayati TaxID=131215 RepID=A0ACC2NY66_9HYME|nr:hypothetical protein QAD02_011949 [Eretmocerus hayati]
MRSNQILIISSLLMTTLTCENTHGGFTKKIKIGYVEIGTKNSHIFLNIRKKDGICLKAELYTRKNDSQLSRNFQIDDNCDSITNQICISDGDIKVAQLTINPDQEVIRIIRSVNDAEASKPKAEIVDCFEMSEGVEWFGGPEIRQQHLPIQQMYFDDEPYGSTHPHNMAIAERYWLTSEGIYIFVDDEVPLFLDQNNRRERHLCFVARNHAPYRYRSKIVLAYNIGVFDNPRKSHENVIARYLGKPKGIPDERMIAKPIWSTWARYKSHVNEKVVLEFANEILMNGFSNSQIEIDDNWETCYGSAKFQQKKFPNVESMVSKLKEKGFRVTLWVHPFINLGCNDGEAYNYALSKNYFIMNEKGDVRMTWWRGDYGAASIDFTNEEAVTWWIGRLKRLQDFGIDSFKFDAGEASWLPQSVKLTGPLELQPFIFTLNYTSNLVKYFNNMIEMRVGWRTQNLPTFVRMLDKDSRWTMNNGLPTLITTLIQMNLNGYVHVLPDMIGGNGYSDTSIDSTERPSKELFIRWLQVNVFMPALQYSFVPWDYDDETVDICKNFTEFHEDVVTPKVIRLMHKAVETGAPVNPPIWWVDPSNVQAHRIADEFLLGEEILVAPVVREGAVSRDIYLPSGKWQDSRTGEIYSGPRWLWDYPAPLNVLPYFNKL